MDGDVVAGVAVDSFESWDQGLKLATEEAWEGDTLMML